MERLAIPMTVLAAAGLLITASCSPAAMNPPGLAAVTPVSTTAPTASVADHNDQDVKFAQMMIPHHRQALEMTKLAETRASSDQVKELAKQIEAVQDSEIQTMSGWLTSWGEQVPGEHAADHDMPGMLSEQQMKKLESLSGPSFDKAFLEMMIEHHEGAVTMAEEEQRNGAYEPAKQLAGSIISSQKAEIAKMKELLQ